MKTFSVLLLSALLAVGLVGGAIAQSTTPPAPGGTTSSPDKPTDTKNDPAPAQPGAQRDQPQATAPSADVKVDVKTDRATESPAALPRTDESRRILGMSPTLLVLIGAVLFVVVIVAIVSMTRNARDTHIDLERRA